MASIRKIEIQSKRSGRKETWYPWDSYERPQSVRVSLGNGNRAEQVKRQAPRYAGGCQSANPDALDVVPDQGLLTLFLDARGARRRARAGWRARSPLPQRRLSAASSSIRVLTIFFTSAAEWGCLR
jgi:hypothetical protein